MFAAFGLLQTSPDIAVPILKEIAQREDIHSLTARTTLEEWESNTLYTHSEIFLLYYGKSYDIDPISNVVDL